MAVQHLDERGTIQPAPQPVLVEVRGPSGRLYGRLDPATMVIEFKDRQSGRTERVDLKAYQIK